MTTAPEISPVAKALPPEVPLRMERAPLHRPQSPLRRRGWRGIAGTVGLTVARLLVLIFTAGLSGYGIQEMVGVLSTDDMTALQYIFLILFSLNFVWISYSFTQSIFGFFRYLLSMVFRSEKKSTEIIMQTAILVPVYNEDPNRVMANVIAMANDLAKDAPERFAFFVLSDTNQPDAWIHEEAAVVWGINAAPAECPLFYRHRGKNTERKAGNIADWVMRWGGAYEAMIVLDADSVMQADTLCTLVRRLQSDPSLGLIQTVPRIIRGRSLFARLQQFANQCYGPIYANGLAFWHGYSSNFWGHNAIIRVCAFAEAARLPILKGEPPFGGHILSHDFAEAAFLRRAGWGVRLDADLTGSYEEAPPSLIDVMIRDRRWCQGNFQHARLLFAEGFSLASRLHFLTGIFAYASALLWLLLVLSGMALALQAQTIRPEYFAEPALFPRWPVFDAERAIDLFIVSAALVLGPKLLGLLAATLNLRELFRFGGPINLVASVVWEGLLSALYAPVMMLAQSRIVVSVLLGHDSGWAPQRRDDGHVPLNEIMRMHLWHTVVGASLGALSWWINPDLFWWTSPLTAGLLLAVPLSAASSSPWVGSVARFLRLGRTAEENAPPAVLLAANASLNRLHKDVAGSAPALVRLSADPYLYAWHKAQTVPSAASQSWDDNTLVAWAKAQHETDPARLAAWLTPAQTMALLLNPKLLPVKERTTDQC